MISENKKLLSNCESSSDKAQQLREELTGCEESLKVLKAQALVVTPPGEWTALGDDGRDRSTLEWWNQKSLELVSLDSGEWKRIGFQLKTTVTNATIVSVHRVENRLLWRRYYLRRREISLKSNNGDPNEHLGLWHGTGGKDPVTILQHEEALDPRFSNAGFYGRGLYLADKASYSNGTAEKTYAFVDSDGTRSLLLVRAALGRVSDFSSAIDRDLRMPPKDDHSGLLYDSVKAVHTVQIKVGQAPWIASYG